MMFQVFRPPPAPASWPDYAVWPHHGIPRAVLIDPEVESAGAVDGVDDIVRDHKMRFAQRLSDIAAEAGAADPHQLGNRLLVLFEGATALATSLNDTAPLVHARAAAASLVDAAMAPDRLI